MEINQEETIEIEKKIIQKMMIILKRNRFSLFLCTLFLIFSCNDKIDFNQYKSIDTYKPSGNLIYDDKSLMNMMNMTDKFKT